MGLNTKSVLIHHHLGLGDHIVCNAIVRKLHKKYKKINSNELEESFFPILWTNHGYRTNV